MAAPYQKALIPGPEKGVAVQDPVSLANIVKKSKKVLLLIGANSIKDEVNEKPYAKLLLDLGKKLNADIVASGAALKYISDNEDGASVYSIAAINIIDRLRDKTWKSLGESGEKYDLIILGGHLIYYASQLLSTLRNFTTYRTVCLDRYHQPNARFSLPNLEKEEWEEYINDFLSKL